MSKKGNIPWNKGVPCSEETKRKISKARMGHEVSEETRKKMSEARKGQIPWIKGRHHSNETKRKISEGGIGRELSKESKKKISESLKGRKKSEETKKKISKALKGRHPSDKSRKKMSKARKGKRFTKEHKEKISESLKGHSHTEETIRKLSKTGEKLWKDQEYRESQLKAILKGLMKRPTSLEYQMVEIIKKHNLPYRYTGDGAVLIGYKNPDFVNTNGEKICIEVANTFHHSEDYPTERANHFKEWGWNCIVFRCDTLDEDEVVTRIQKLEG